MGSDNLGIETQCDWGVPQFTKSGAVEKAIAEARNPRKFKDIGLESVQEPVEENKPVYHKKSHVFFSEPRKSHVVSPLPHTYIKY
jgi:hypothetical protein